MAPIKAPLAFINHKMLTEVILSTVSKSPQNAIHQQWDLEIFHQR